MKYYINRSGYKDVGAGDFAEQRNGWLLELG